MEPFTESFMEVTDSEPEAPGATDESQPSVWYRLPRRSRQRGPEWAVSGRDDGTLMTAFRRGGMLSSRMGTMAS